MRLPRFRFTLRWLMVAVAITAMTIWCQIAYRRYIIYPERTARYGERAAHYARLEKSELLYLEEYTQMLAESDEDIAKSNKKMAQSSLYRTPFWKNLAQQRQQHHASIVRQIAYHRKRCAPYTSLRRKYEHAAHHPWLPLAPNPPE